MSNRYGSLVNVQVMTAVTVNDGVSSADETVGAVEEQSRILYLIPKSARYSQRKTQARERLQTKSTNSLLA